VIPVSHGAGRPLGDAAPDAFHVKWGQAGIHAEWALTAIVPEDFGRRSRRAKEPRGLRCSRVNGNSRGTPPCGVKSGLRRLVGEARRGQRYLANSYKRWYRRKSTYENWRTVCPKRGERSVAAVLRNPAPAEPGAHYGRPTCLLRRTARFRDSDPRVVPSRILQLSDSGAIAGSRLVPPRRRGTSLCI
jgi:hypothetical protein